MMIFLRILDVLQHCIDNRSYNTKDKNCYRSYSSVSGTGALVRILFLFSFLIKKKHAFRAVGTFSQLSWNIKAKNINYKNEKLKLRYLTKK
jgi:hypothetical protein